MAGLSRKLRNHAEALAVWTYAKKIKAEVYRTKLDMRSCVPQYNGWRVLGQLRRSGKGINRCDLYILPPDMLPSLPLRALRPRACACTVVAARCCCCCAVGSAGGG